LGHIALERTKTARDAIRLMGELSEMYGFYGADETDYEGTSESLLIADKNEAWVFHILGDDTGAGSIWAAQRVPDDHFAAVTNVFIIRDIDFDSEDFMYSKNIKEVAIRNNLWNDDEPFDFTSIYSAGEGGHKYYNGRRMWMA